MTSTGIHGTVVDEFDGVGATRVLRLAYISEIGNTLVIEHDVFEHRSSTSGCAKDLRLILFGQIDEFCVATTFEIEDTVCAPAVLIVAD